MDYIIKNLENLDDTYAYALAAYAMQLAGHNGKDFVLQNLMSKAKIVGDKKYWDKPIPPSESKNIWYTKPNSVNTEMTAYGLLAIMESGHYTEGLPFTRWLLSQRNDHGGFQSTQDTVVGLQALAKMAEKISSKDNNVQVVVTYNNGVESKMNINKENAMILQQYEVSVK